MMMMVLMLMREVCLLRGGARHAHRTARLCSTSFSVWGGSSFGATRPSRTTVCGRGARVCVSVPLMLLSLGSARRDGGRRPRRGRSARARLFRAAGTAAITVVLLVVPVVLVARVPTGAPARVGPPRAALAHVRCAIAPGRIDPRRQSWRARAASSATRGRPEHCTDTISP